MTRSSPPRTPAGLRWECQGTGACCRAGFALGPVEPEVICGLDEARIGELWAPAADGFSELRPGPDGRTHPFLRSVDGACVFLRDDQLCAVHALLGPLAKPGFCREFPHHVLTDPGGPVVVVRPTCQGFGVSFRSGPELGAELDEVLALHRVVPRAHFAPDRVRVLSGIEVDLATWMQWESQLLRALEEPGGPEQLLPRARALLATLANTPLEPRTRQAYAARHATLTVLDRVMSRVLAQPGGEPHQQAFARDRATDLRTALEALDEPLPALADDAETYVALLARSFVLSKRFAAWGGVAEGLGLFALGIDVARVVAGGHGSPVSAARLGPAVADWSRFESIGPITHILRRAQPALGDLFLHLGSQG